MSEENQEKKLLQKAYSVTKDKNGKEYWNAVGIASPHKDGQGTTVKLHSVPVNGEVVLRNMRDQKMQDYDQQQVAQDQQPAQDVNQTQGYEPQI